MALSLSSCAMWGLHLPVPDARAIYASVQVAADPHAAATGWATAARTATAARCKPSAAKTAFQQAGELGDTVLCLLNAVHNASPYFMGVFDCTVCFACACQLCSARIFIRELHRDTSTAAAVATAVVAACQAQRLARPASLHSLKSAQRQTRRWPSCCGRQRMLQDKNRRAQARFRERQKVSDGPRASRLSPLHRCLWHVTGCSETASSCRAGCGPQDHRSGSRGSAGCSWSVRLTILTEWHANRTRLQGGSPKWLMQRRLVLLFSFHKHTGVRSESQVQGRGV